MRLKCLPLLLVVTVIATLTKADSFNSEEDGLKPSLSCIVWGDPGCRRKCSLLCTAFGCLSCNPQCNTVFCDCQEKLPIRALGVLPVAPNSVDLPPDITFRQLLVVKFMRTPVFRDLDKVMPTVPELEMEVKKFLYTTDLSGRELKQEMKRRFPTLRSLFRRLRPRPLAQLDPNVSAEVLKEGINVEPEIQPQTQSYFSSWLKPKPKKFDVNSPENQQRIINLIKKLPYKHDIIETFEVLRDSPEKPLYRNICRYFLKEGMLSPDGSQIIKPTNDPNELEKKVLNDDVIKQLQDRIDESNEQRKNRKRKRVGPSGENSSEENDAKKPRLDQPMEQSSNNGWWSPPFWGKGQTPGNANSPVQTPATPQQSTANPSDGWWWGWGNGKGTPKSDNGKPSNTPPLKDITNTMNGPALQPNTQTPNQGPNSSWKWPSWNWPSGSGPQGSNTPNENQSLAQLNPMTGSSPANSLIPTGTPIMTNNSGRSLNPGEVINPIPEDTGETPSKKTPKKRKRKKLRKIAKTKDLPEDIFPDMENIDKTLGKPKKKRHHKHRKVESEEDSPDGKHKKHKKRKHSPDSEESESDSDESSSEEETPKGNAPAHKKRKKHHKKTSDSDESTIEEITPSGSQPHKHKKKKHHKKPVDSDESSSEEVTPSGSQPKPKKKKKHHKKPVNQDSSEEIPSSTGCPKRKRKKDSDNDDDEPSKTPSKNKKKKTKSDNSKLSPTGDKDSSESSSEEVSPDGTVTKHKKKKKKKPKNVTPSQSAKQSKPLLEDGENSDESSSEEIPPNAIKTKHKKKTKKIAPSEPSQQLKPSAGGKSNDGSSSEEIAPDGTITKHKKKKNAKSSPLSESKESDSDESTIEEEPTLLSNEPLKKPKEDKNEPTSLFTSTNSLGSPNESKIPKKSSKTKKPKNDKDTSEYPAFGASLVPGSQLPASLAGNPSTSKDDLSSYPTFNLSSKTTPNVSSDIPNLIAMSNMLEPGKSLPTKLNDYGSRSIGSPTVPKDLDSMPMKSSELMPSNSNVFPMDQPSISSSSLPKMLSLDNASGVTGKPKLIPNSEKDALQTMLKNTPNFAASTSLADKPIDLQIGPPNSFKNLDINKQPSSLVVPSTSQSLLPPNSSSQPMNKSSVPSTSNTVSKSPDTLFPSLSSLWSSPTEPVDVLPSHYYDDFSPPTLSNGLPSTNPSLLDKGPIAVASKPIGLLPEGQTKLPLDNMQTALPNTQNTPQTLNKGIVQESPNEKPSPDSTLAQFFKQNPFITVPNNSGNGPIQGVSEGKQPSADGNALTQLLKQNPFISSPKNIGNLPTQGASTMKQSPLINTPTQLLSPEVESSHQIPIPKGSPGSSAGVLPTNLASSISPIFKDNGLEKSSQSGTTTVPNPHQMDHNPDIDGLPSSTLGQLPIMQKGGRDLDLNPENISSQLHSSEISKDQASPLNLKSLLNSSVTPENNLHPISSSVLTQDSINPSISGINLIPSKMPSTANDLLHNGAISGLQSSPIPDYPFKPSDTLKNGVNSSPDNSNKPLSTLKNISQGNALPDTLINKVSPTSEHPIDSNISPSTIDSSHPSILNDGTNPTDLPRPKLSLKDLLKHKFNKSMPPGSSGDGSQMSKKPNSDVPAPYISVPNPILTKELSNNMPPSNTPKDARLEELVNKLKTGDLNSPINQPNTLNSLLNPQKTDNPLNKANNLSPVNPEDEYLHELVNKLKSENSLPSDSQSPTTNSSSAIPSGKETKDPVDHYLEKLVNELKSGNKPPLDSHSPLTESGTTPHDIILQGLVDKLKAENPSLILPQSPSNTNAGRSFDSPEPLTQSGTTPHDIILQGIVDKLKAENPSLILPQSPSNTNAGRSLDSPENTLDSKFNQLPQDILHSSFPSPDGSILSNVPKPSSNVANANPIDKSEIANLPLTLNNLLDEAKEHNTMNGTPHIGTDSPTATTTPNDLTPFSSSKNGDLASNILPITPLGLSNNPSGNPKIPNISKNPITSNGLLITQSPTQMASVSPTDKNTSDLPSNGINTLSSIAPTTPNILPLPSSGSTDSLLSTEPKQNPPSQIVPSACNSGTMGNGDSLPNKNTSLHNNLAALSPLSESTKDSPLSLPSNNDALGAPKNTPSPKTDLLKKLLNSQSPIKAVPLSNNSDNAFQNDLNQPSDSATLPFNSQLPSNSASSSPLSTSDDKGPSTENPKEKVPDSDEHSKMSSSVEHDSRPPNEGDSKSNKSNDLSPTLQQMPLSSLSPILMPTDGNPFEAFLSGPETALTNLTPPNSGEQLPKKLNLSPADSTSHTITDNKTEPIKSSDGTIPSPNFSPTTDSPLPLNIGRSLDHELPQIIDHSTNTNIPDISLGTPNPASVLNHVDGSPTLQSSNSPILPLQSNSNLSGSNPIEKNTEPSLSGSTPITSKAGNTPSPLSSNPKFASLFKKLKDANSDSPKNNLNLPTSLQDNSAPTMTSTPSNNIAELPLRSISNNNSPANGVTPALEDTSNPTFTHFSGTPLTNEEPSYPHSLSTQIPNGTSNEKMSPPIMPITKSLDTLASQPMNKINDEIPNPIAEGISSIINGQPNISETTPFASIPSSPTSGIPNPKLASLLKKLKDANSGPFKDNPNPSLNIPNGVATPLKDNSPPTMTSTPSNNISKPILMNMPLDTTPSSRDIASPLEDKLNPALNNFGVMPSTTTDSSYPPSTLTQISNGINNDRILSKGNPTGNEDSPIITAKPNTKEITPSVLSPSFGNLPSLNQPSNNELGYNIPSLETSKSPNTKPQTGTAADLSPSKDVLNPPLHLPDTNGTSAPVQLDMISNSFPDSHISNVPMSGNPLLAGANKVTTPNIATDNNKPANLINDPFSNKSITNTPNVAIPITQPQSQINSMPTMLPNQVDSSKLNSPTSPLSPINKQILPSIDPTSPTNPQIKNTSPLMQPLNEQSKNALPTSLNSKSSDSPSKIPNSISITPIHPNSPIQSILSPSPTPSPTSNSNLNPSKPLGDLTSPPSTMFNNPSSKSSPKSIQNGNSPVSSPGPNSVTSNPLTSPLSHLDDLDDSVPWLDDEVDISDDSMEFLHNRPKPSFKPTTNKNGSGVPGSIPPLPLQAPNSSPIPPIIPKDLGSINNNNASQSPPLKSGISKPPSAIIGGENPVNLLDSKTPLSNLPNLNPPIQPANSLIPSLLNNAPNIPQSNPPIGAPSTTTTPDLQLQSPSLSKPFLQPPNPLMSNPSIPDLTKSSAPSDSKSIPNILSPLSKTTQNLTPTIQPSLPTSQPQNSSPLFGSGNPASTNMKLPPSTDNSPLSSMNTPGKLPDNLQSPASFAPSPSLPTDNFPKKPSIDLRKLFTSEEIPDELLSKENTNHHDSPLPKTSPLITPTSTVLQPSITPPQTLKQPSINLKKFTTSDELPSDLFSGEHNNVSPPPSLPSITPLQSPQQISPPSPLFTKPFGNFNNMQPPLAPPNTTPQFPNFNKPPIFTSFDDLPASPPPLASFKPSMLPPPTMTDFDFPIMLPKSAPPSMQSDPSSDDPSKRKNSGQNWRQKLSQKKPFQSLS